MRTVWAGLVLFVVMTALAATAYNIVDFASRPPRAENSLVIFRPDTIVFMNAFLVALATLPSVLLMIVASFGQRRGPLVGLVSILVVAVAWGLVVYLDMALSPYEPKRAAQGGAIWWFLGGLLYLVPSYLLSYVLLRRTQVMAPLFASATPAKSTGLP